MASTQGSSPTSDIFSSLDLVKIKAELESNGKINCPTPTCSETFKSIWGLKFHLKKNSCNSPKFKCDKCQGAFQSRIVLQQHTCGPSNKDTHASIFKKDATGSSVNQDIVSSDVSEKNKSAENAPGNQEILSQKRKTKQPTKPEIVTAMNPPGKVTENSINSDEGCFLSPGITKPSSQEGNVVIEGNLKEVDTSQMQKPKEISSDNQDTLTTQRKRRGRPRKTESTTATEASIEIESDSSDATSQASGTKENYSNNQEVSTLRRKRGRPQANKITVTKATIEKECGYYTDEETANQINNGNICSTTNNAAETSVEDLMSPKRKRGRPRKSESPASMTHEDGENDVSSRARNEAFAHHLDAEENYRTKDIPGKDGKTDSSVSKDLLAPIKRKRTPGRPKKNVECVTLEDSSETKNAATPVRKRGRPRKVRTDGPVGGSVRKNSARSASKRVNYAEKEDDDSDEDSATDDSDDASPSAKKSKPRTSEDRIAAADGDENEEDDDDVDDDNMKTPKSKKTKENTISEKLIASLRKQLRTGKISCTNKCGKKFASIAGLKFHLEICGKEREIIKCEQCGKEYTTQAGLKYHMNSFHVETEVESEEKQDEGNQDDTEIEEPTIDITADTPKRPRRAAARAKQKFQEIGKEQKKVDKTPKQSGYGSRSSALDPHIKKVREGLITPALMEKFKKELKKSGSIVCPNEDCKKKFNIYISFNNHYLQCGFDTSPFECMLCGQEYNSIDGARSHVEKIHEMFGKDGSIQESEASGSEQERSDDYSDSDEEYKHKSDEESNEEDEEEDDDGDLIGYDDDDRSEDGVEDDDTLNWDKKKRRYKVEMNRKGERGSDLILYVGRWNKTFREFEKWRKKNFSQKESFPKHMPTLDHWSRVKDSDVSDYTPSSTQSPHFRIERPNIAKHKNTSDTQLPVFTGLTKEDCGIHGDRIFYTGGPVWELSWCPIPDGQREENQYLVASAHKSFDTVYKAYECHKNKALLQVWNLGPLLNTLSSSGASPTLAIGIAHDFGPVWRISWCPNGAWQSPQSNNKDKMLSRLGLMAMACGDGIVRIISVPHPHELLSKLNSSEDVTEESEQRVLVHCEPHLELYPCSLNATYSGRRGQAMCVEWSPLEPYDKVAAGFSDGTVAVWNLLSESPFLRKHNGDKKQTIRLAPFVLIKAHASIIRDLAFCPANADFLVTGGHDRCYRIWDLKSSMTPVFVTKKGFPYEVEWPFYANGFLYCQDVMYFRDEPSVRFCNLAFVKPRNTFLQFPSCVFTFSCNNWINVAASADVAGNVMLSKMVSSGKQRWHLYNVKLEDLKGNGEASDSTSNTKSQDQQSDADLKVKSRSLKEEVNSSRIVFEDKNSLQFRFSVSKNNKEIEEKLKSLKYNCSSMQAIHKVRWNPNKQALTWIASGGASGLVRIHHVRQVEPHHLKSAS